MRRLVIPLVATALVTAGMLYQARSVEPVLTELPPVALTDIAGFESETLEPGEAELHTLPADTAYDKRRYFNAQGEWFAVTMVKGGHSKSSIHRPEMCLPAQGFQMMNPRELEVAGIDWHMVTLGRSTLAPMGFAYTFFNQEGFRTASHVRRILRDVWDRSIVGRVDRWVMVTVYASTADDRRLGEFLHQLKGMIEWQR